MWQISYDTLYNLIYCLSFILLTLVCEGVKINSHMLTILAQLYPSWLLSGRILFLNSMSHEKG